MDGWEPQEVQTYLDADGEPCAASEAHQVIVEREPEWDEETCRRAESLLAYERTLCGGCGNPLEQTLDKNTWWIVHDDTCMACRAKAVVERDFATAHENDKPRKGTPTAWDGRNFYVLPKEPPEGDER